MLTGKTLCFDLSVSAISQIKYRVNYVISCGLRFYYRSIIEVPLTVQKRLVSHVRFIENLWWLERMPSMRGKLFLFCQICTVSIIIMVETFHAFPLYVDFSRNSDVCTNIFCLHSFHKDLTHLSLSQFSRI